LLAKIDNFQFKETRNIDFVNILNTQLVYLKDLAENIGLNVTVDINNPLTIQANPILLESLINNLVVNSIRHNIDNGLISIIVNGDTFSVSNTGDTNPLNKDRIFKRFSRPSEEKKGNGLGLSIVVQICKLHGWDVEYSYRDKLHTFVIKFS
jgi:signal transduction histidine kinase